MALPLKDQGRGRGGGDRCREHTKDDDDRMELVEQIRFDTSGTQSTAFLHCFQRLRRCNEEQNRTAPLGIQGGDDSTAVNNLIIITRVHGRLQY